MAKRSIVTQDQINKLTTLRKGFTNESNGSGPKNIHVPLGMFLLDVCVILDLDAPETMGILGSSLFQIVQQSIGNCDDLFVENDIKSSNSELVTEGL